MSELLPRTGPVARIVSTAERGSSAVPAPVPPRSAHDENESEASYAPTVSRRSSAAADYARLQADIADVLARIDPAGSKGIETASVAERQILAMMPSPVIMLPLPPTDPALVAFVAQVAQSVAERAAQARAAQAHATPIMVEAAAH